ncbi:hypothetical protein OG254_11835 [Streptomyces sp. NBC_01092]|nr:hypothetical protein OG254_11835 [Streptomyces sp. NBC_01092]
MGRRSQTVSDPLSDISRDILAPNDGWAAADGGTTGGSTADDAHVFTVRNRSELVRALDAGSATPKIIRIAGTIDANTDGDGDHLDCADYATDGYSTSKYLAAYDPRTWGPAKPSGPQEEARQASAARQAERIELTVGSHTTIVGLGTSAGLKGASLQLKDAHNVIVRNLELRDAYDCFPVWQPNTGGLGDWKTAYVNMWLRGATHVWIDHVTLSDKGHSDEQEPTYFGRNYLRHDGLLDITNASDLVNSWNGTALHQSGTLWGSPRTESGGGYPVDLLAIYNAYNSGSERDLTADVGWTPTLHTKIDSAEAADRAVARGAGAGRIP